MEQITKRLLPGQDLKDEIEKIVQKNQIKAGVLLSIVGSLAKMQLRIADGVTVKDWQRQFEIVSGTGTLSQAGCHIHISAAGTDGIVFGGHLKQGCIIGTTAEIVVLKFEDVEYKRLPDNSTGYDELSISVK